MRRSHRMPFGAQFEPDGSVRFRLWAPGAKTVSVCLGEENERRLPLASGNDGWFELVTKQASSGTLYRYQIDDGVKVPDPASRLQPRDVHGPSQVLDPSSFEWDDDDWHGLLWDQAVIYELHVGAFSPSGTFQGVQARLDYLRSVGVNAIELMPVSDFPGRRNWGYDGVFPFAPDTCYGSPDDLKNLVQEAHRKGLMMFLDVVYNHFGPDGNYLRAYAPDFFTNRHRTPWGDGINFDGTRSKVVRDFFIQNALYWIEEYRFDGLRLDAVHAIQDDSHPDILKELARGVREACTPDRHVHLILENFNNSARYLSRNAHGRVCLFDAQWNDDIHHCLHVLLTGESDGYYSDYAQRPLQQLGRCLTEGFAFQGDYSPYHKQNRGEPSRHLPPSAFVSFLQNHDQIGNRAFGERILQLANTEAVRAAMAILLLAPEVPMLFMGEEFGAKTPFLFFCDFEGDLARAVTEGRRNEFQGFAKFGVPDMRERIPDPNADKTFQRSKLNWNEAAGEGNPWPEFYRHLLNLRKQKIVPYLSSLRAGESKFDVIENRGLAVQWPGISGVTLHLLTNLSNEALNAEALFGELLFATHAWAVYSSVRVLPPWFAGWFLEV